MRAVMVGEIFLLLGEDFIEDNGVVRIFVTERVKAAIRAENRRAGK